MKRVKSDIGTGGDLLLVAVPLLCLLFLMGYLCIHFLAAPRYRLTQIDALFDEGNFEEALAMCEEGNADDPNVSARIEKAETAIRNQDEAQRAYENGSKRMRAGAYEEAIECFADAVSLSPEEASYQVFLQNARNAVEASKWYADGVNAYGQKNLPLAITNLTTAIELYNADARFYRQRGMAYLDQEEYGCSLDDFLKAIDLDPDEPTQWNFAGVVMSHVGWYEESYEHFREAYARNPADADVRENYAVSLSNIEDYEAAVAGYDELLAADADNASLYAGRALALYCLEQYDDAVANYERAIELDPENPQNYINIGNTLTWLDQFEESLECYDAALAIDPDDAQAYVYKGSVLECLERYDQAEECYQKALAIDPDNQSAKDSLRALENGHRFLTGENKK